MEKRFPLRLVLIAVILNGELGSAFLYSEWFDDLTTATSSGGMLKPSQAYQSSKPRHGQKEATRRGTANEKPPSDKLAGEAAKQQNPPAKMTFRDYQQFRDAQRSRRLASWLSEGSGQEDEKDKEKEEETESARENTGRETETEAINGRDDVPSAKEKEVTTRLREEWEEMERMVRENEREKIRRMEMDAHRRRKLKSELVDEDSERHGHQRKNGLRDAHEKWPVAEDLADTVDKGQGSFGESRGPMSQRRRVLEEGTPHENRGTSDEEERGGRSWRETEEEEELPRKRSEREENLDKETEWTRRDHSYPREQTWEERAENSQGDQGKPLPTVFPYNAIAGIVSIIWLVNILFIAWLVFGRENQNNMRIPSNFEYKPPVKVVRSRSVHLTNEEEHNEGAERSTHIPGSPRENLEATLPTRSSSPISPSTLQKATLRPWSSVNTETLPPSRPPSPPAHQLPPTLPAPDTSSWSPKKLQPKDFSSYSGRPSLVSRLGEFAPSYSLVAEDRSRHASASPRSYATHIRPMYETTYTGRQREPKANHFSAETEKCDRTYHSNLIASDPLGSSTTRLRGTYRDRDRYSSGDTTSRFTNYNVSKHEASEEDVAQHAVVETTAEPVKYPWSRDRTAREDAERCDTEKCESNNQEKVPVVQWKDNYVGTHISINRESNGEAKSSKERGSVSAGVEVYDIKEFVSLPNEILDVLACSNPGTCHHDHSKFRMVGDKLYFLSAGTGNHERSYSTAVDGSLPLSDRLQKILLNKQHRSNLAAPSQTSGVENTGDGLNENKGARQSVALSPIPQEVSTQITPEVSQKRLLSQQAATASATTQCPSSLTVTKNTSEKQTGESQLARGSEAIYANNTPTDTPSLKQVPTVNFVSPREKTQSEVCIPQKAKKANRSFPRIPNDQERMDGPSDSDIKTMIKSHRNMCCSVSKSCVKCKAPSQKHEKQDASDVQYLQQPNSRICNTGIGISKAENKTHHSKDCTSVAPPPFGYHIRKDYSSSESTMDVVGKGNARTASKHVHTIPGIARINEIQQSEKQPGISADNETNPKVDSHKITGKRRGQCQTYGSSSKVDKEHEEEKHKEGGDGAEGDECVKTSKKLMIIGKLNYYNVGRKRNDKSSSKSVLHIGLSRSGDHGNEYDQTKKVHKTAHKTPKSVSLRHKIPKEIVVGVPSDCRNGSEEGYGQAKISEKCDYIPLSQESAMWLREAVDDTGKLAQRCRPKNKMARPGRFPRTVNSLSHSIKGWKQMAKDKKKKSPRYSSNGEKMKPTCGIRHLQKRHLLPRVMAKDMEYTSDNADFLPSYHLNVNTNAGIIDNCGDDPRAEIKQMSSTSVHSNEQYFSTHTDTPEVKIIDSDVEVSQSFSFTDDLDKPVVSKAPEYDTTAKKGDDQEGQISEDWEEKKQSIMQACNEAIKNRLHHRNLEQIISEEEYMALDKQPQMNPQATAGMVAIDTSPAPVTKHKKKTKTTEALYFKIESSMSKKVTTTTVVKDGRKIHQDKPKQEQQKQMSADEASRSIVGLQEKGDKKCAGETPRHTKIIRYSEGIGDISGHGPRQNQSSDINIESTARNSKPPARSAESDHRNAATKDGINNTCRSEDLNHVKQITCWPTKDMPPLESPEAQLSPRGYSEKQMDMNDSDKASEKASSVITVVHLLPSQTGLPKDAANKDLHAKEGLLSDRRSDKSDSPCSQKSPSAEGSSLKRVRPRSKGDSSSRKSSPEIGSKQSAKPKKPAIKNKGKSVEESVKEAVSDDGIEAMKLKHLQQQILSIRKKSPLRKKLHSRSPDLKKKRRSAKKKESHADSKSEEVSTEESRAEKPKKQKGGEKDKKKRKRKVSSHSDDEAYLGDTPHDKKVVRSRSRSSDTQKATQTVSCSAFSPRVVDHLIQSGDKNKLGSLVWKGQSKESEEKDKKGKEKSFTGEEPTRSTEKEFGNKTRDQKMKNLVASADNVLVTSGLSVYIRSAESIPTFTSTVHKTPTKVVQVPSCLPGKKSEKDLQQAEMGWNSSMISEASKAAAEKAKMVQKRSKMRYYLVKPKQKQTEREVAFRPKRPAIQLNNVEGDGACSISDLDLMSDIHPKEKNGTGQGKSVQFSDSIEELEASRIDIQCDSSASPDRQDMLEQLNETCNPIIDEPLCVEMECNKTSKTEAPKLEVAKLELEQKTQNTPPRRKRPVWLKKSNNSHGDSKDGKAKMVSKSNTTGKGAPVQPKNALVNAGLPLKMRHSTDNLVKPDSRFNFHVYYPVQPTCGSPKTSNISLNEKRTVAYNTWINSIFLAAPLNKATKKLVAKVGSPVDIKEIIEGSSVDAADHFRMMRSLQEASLRTAKSVPALGPSRPPSVNVSGGKQAKSQKVIKALKAKKNKETKPQESGSSRSLSSVAFSEDSIGSATQLGPINRNMPMDSTFAMSSDVDEGTCKPKGRLNRRLAVSQRREKKHGKRSMQPLVEAVNSWQLVAGQETENSQALNRMNYYGDMELNVLNMGVAWMVQSVFNRLSFLSPRSQESAAEASGDMHSSQQIIE